MRYVPERDLTFLASQVLGQWFYLYLILDVYSRKIVGFEVHESGSSEHAVALLRRTALAEGLHSLPQKPVLHGDNGSTMKATTVLAMIHWLGLRVSHSHPRVSDNNAFAAALFRTAKYSGIRYVSPAERHAGRDVEILARRHELYRQARAVNPRLRAVCEKYLVSVTQGSNCD